MTTPLSPKERKRLERLAWSITHRDFRGMFEGGRSVLVNGPHGTTIKLLSAFTDEELRRYLGKRARF